jgi:hypothetical protein
MKDPGLNPAAERNKRLRPTRYDLLREWVVSNPLETLAVIFFFYYAVDWSSQLFTWLFVKIGG